MTSNPLRLPLLPTRAVREAEMERILIGLSLLKDSQGLYINTASFCLTIRNIYIQAEDAAEEKKPIPVNGEEIYRTIE